MTEELFLQVWQAKPEWWEKTAAEKSAFVQNLARRTQTKLPLALRPEAVPLVEKVHTGVILIWANLAQAEGVDSQINEWLPREGFAPVAFGISTRTLSARALMDRLTSE